MDPALEVLRSVAVFAGLQAEVLSRLRANAEIITFAPGEIILREGEPADAAWVLLEGDVQIFKARPGGAVSVLCKLHSGALLGEQGLLNDVPRGASARAHTTVRALRIPGADFQTALQPEHPLRQHLASVGEQQRRANLARESVVLQQVAREGGLGAGVRERTFTDGEVLFREGEEAQHLYIILSGHASVYQSSAAGPVLIRRMEAGQTIGERALVRGEPRAATVIASGALRTYEIDAARFSEMQRRSTELREHLRTVERVYALPRRGFMTQYAGRFLDREAVNTVYDLDGDARLIASHVVGEALCNLERVGTPVPAAPPLRFVDAARGVDRELRLSLGGEILGLTVYGEWPELAELSALAIAGQPIESERVASFRHRGALGPARPTDHVLLAARAPSAGDPVRDSVVCGCVNLRRADLHRAIGQGLRTVEVLQRETRCGTVCGGCLPTVREILGEPGWTPVRVQAESVLCEGVRAYQLSPIDGVVLPALPGQHVVIQAEIDGSWVQRPYTLSGGGPELGYYEVTIKREAQGLFSRWMFDGRRAESALRVSAPQGDYHWRPGECDVVCLVAGIGVTPALAMCRAALAQGSPRSLWIDYSARYSRDFAYEAELRAAAAAQQNIHLTLRETSQQGRLGAGEVRCLAARFPTARFYLCGPSEYLESAARHLAAAGVPQERVRCEAFLHVGDPPRAALPAPTVPARPAPLQPAAPPRESTLFVDPKDVAAPPPPPRAVRWLAGLADRYRFELTLAGRRVNPVEAAVDAVETRLSGRDARVPAERLAIAKRAVLGPLVHQVAALDHYGRALRVNRQRALDARRRGAPLPPHTPDGQTWTFTVPSIEFLQFTGKNAVETGWRRLADTPLSPVYVTRSPTALRELFCDAKNVDRGSVPNHYWQQLVGYPGMTPAADRKPAGLLIGQYRDNCMWRRDRAVAQEHLGPAALERHAATMTQALTRLCKEEIDPFVARYPGRAVDANVLMGQIALRMIMITSFGGIAEAQVARLGTEIMAIVRRTMDLMTEFHLAKLQRKAEFEREVIALRGAVSELIAALRAADAQGVFTPEQLAAPLLQLVLRGEGQGPPDDDLLEPIMAVLIVAGHETTASTMSWALYELGRDPELYRTIVAEVDAFREAHGGRPMTAHDYDERPYTLALLQELGRCHPPLPQLTRSALTAGTVPPDPETGIGAFDYPKDATFVLSVLGAHMNEEVFPQPSAFRIERFLDGVHPGMSLRERGRRVRDNARRLEEQFRLIPFSAGPVVCPGRGFNMLEIFLVLDTLLRRYVIELLHPDREIVATQNVALNGPAVGAHAVRFRRRP